MTFNIHKLRLQMIPAKEREFRTCGPKSRDRIRSELAALRMALLIAQQNSLDVQRRKREGRAA